MNTFLIVYASGNEQKDCMATQVWAIMCDFKSSSMMSRTIDIPKSLHDDLKTPMSERSAEVERKLDKLTHEFLNFNWMYDQADVVIAHGVKYNQKMVLAIPEFDHWGQKKWICTMQQFEWPLIPNPAKRWLQLKFICEAYGVEFSKMANKAELVLKCLLKIGDLPARLANMKPFGEKTKC